ncbi:hypothetical protein HNQ91_002735 [Filimonas zeae]|uniref:Uncharacterized protein n=1 Tax=Filimonas zeae TaxID=1737353 RepID=A0A917MW85_9BACT|nr:hypothetical protein [Filimonas zeae]MDR6339670.1 hypothetical protein [Filimonas zeae]GGH69072.1 hypothetical protein GCM10011379_26010 [Filimonas zeae]
MSNNQSSPYYIFTEEIRLNWKENGIRMVKVAEMETGGDIRFYELTPDPEFILTDDTVYSIDSEDITELSEPVPHAKFVVHEVHLDFEDE